MALLGEVLPEKGLPSGQTKAGSRGWAELGTCLTNEGWGLQRSRLRVHSPASFHLQRESQTKTQLLLEAASYRADSESSREQETGRQRGCPSPWPHLFFSLTLFSVLDHPISPPSLFFVFILILPSLFLFFFLHVPPLPCLFPQILYSNPDLLLDT